MTPTETAPSAQDELRRKALDVAYEKLSHVYHCQTFRWPNSMRTILKPAVDAVLGVALAPGKWSSEWPTDPGLYFVRLEGFDFGKDMEAIAQVRMRDALPWIGGQMAEAKLFLPNGAITDIFQNSEYQYKATWRRLSEQFSTTPTD